MQARSSSISGLWSSKISYLTILLWLASIELHQAFLNQPRYLFKNMGCIQSCSDICLPALTMRSKVFYKLSMSSSSPPPADPFFPVKVIANTQEAIGLKKLVLEVPPDIISQFTKPGQYVKIKISSPDAKPGFFAIASPPSSTATNTLTFLIKETPSSEFLTSNSNANLEMSLPLGKGFNIEDGFEGYKNDFPTLTILMMATGSGIAPIASAIESSILKLKTVSSTSLFAARKAKLYLGARTPKHLPFTDRFPAWQEMGVEIVPVISQPSDTLSAGWTGKTGYIQDTLKEDGVAIPRNTGVLLCGQNDMTEKVKALCLEAGVFEGRLLLNF